MNMIELLRTMKLNDKTAARTFKGKNDESPSSRFKICLKMEEDDPQSFIFAWDLNFDMKCTPFCSLKTSYFVSWNEK